MLLIDPDHFSLINDKTRIPKWPGFGSNCKGARVSTTPRRLDRPSWGEEFGVLLRDVRIEQAGTIAENIRRLVEASPMAKGQQDGVKVTVSIGGAEISPNADAQDVLRTAGRCLFEPKQHGRNRVSFDYEAAMLRVVTP
ncbi:diguanylate cyclase [Mesorhizobium sp. M0276]|uniref:diguanylate cyclase n=1 Tax=Mesorhizobium sp. M0276 TaxID=2956928 RepID=UPI0033386391